LRQALIEAKEQNLEKRYITLEDQSLSDAEKAEQIKGIDERILEMDTRLSGLKNNCKQSPEGSSSSANLKLHHYTGERMIDSYNTTIETGEMMGPVVQVHQ